MPTRLVCFFFLFIIINVFSTSYFIGFSFERFLNSRGHCETSGRPNCPYNWYTFEHTCYIVLGVKSSFVVDAYYHCQLKQAKLLSINTIDELNYIKTIYEIKNENSIWVNLFLKKILNK